MRINRRSESVQHDASDPSATEAIELSAVETCRIGKDAGMDAPFVLATASRAHAVDHNFAIVEFKRRAATQEIVTERIHRMRQRQVMHERAEEGEWRLIPGLPSRKLGGNFGRKWRLERDDSWLKRISLFHGT